MTLRSVRKNYSAFSDEDIISEHVLAAWKSHENRII